MLSAFRRNSCETTFLGSDVCTERPWTDPSIQMLRQLGLHDVRIFGPWGKRSTWAKRQVTRVGRRVARLFGAVPDYTVDGAWKQWFAKELERLQPNVILMNYSRWDWLLDHKRWQGAVRIVETHDLMSVNARMRKRLAPFFAGERVNPLEIDDQALQEDFFADTGQPDEAELDVYRHYDRTIAICRAEGEILDRHIRGSKVVLVPITCAPVEGLDDYSGRALFLASDNPFNLQGYSYFVRKVLPRIQERLHDFQLIVAGPICSRVDGAKDVQLAGVVDDLAGQYGSACFAVSPVFGGTGQQVKIVEAMAHGRAVVAMGNAAARSPLRHGENGLVARDAAEFAESVIRLWKDRELCRVLGKTARETIRNECSSKKLEQCVGEMLKQLCA